MRNWDISDEMGKCTADQDCEDARFVCNHFGVPFHEVNFVRQYWNEVFSPLVSDYERGITPNPDVLCNRHIKFGHLFHYATERLAADALATGHYARSSAGPFLEKPVDKSRGIFLLQSADPSKDQTLFLSQIHQRALHRTMFPVGEFRKSAVKAMAAEAGLDAIVRKKESTGICFVGKRLFQDFIDQYVEPQPGNFVDIETGAVVGQHKGVHYWTIGQRTHLSGLNRAYFVADRHAPSQTVFVASGTDHPALFSRFLSTAVPHWINRRPEDWLRKDTDGNVKTFRCQFRFQHTHPLIECQVGCRKNGKLKIELEKPIRAIAPGQYAVLYFGEECLGSAQIVHVGPSLFELKTSSERCNSFNNAVS